jgi:hypothetical protein
MMMMIFLVKRRVSVTDRNEIQLSLIRNSIVIDRNEKRQCDYLYGFACEKKQAKDLGGKEGKTASCTPLFLA